MRVVELNLPTPGIAAAGISPRRSISWNCQPLAPHEWCFYFFVSTLTSDQSAGTHGVVGYKIMRG
jgi:hypothetical protein